MPLRSYWETLVTAQADGNTLTAAARAVCTPAAALFTLPPNYFDVIGKQLIIRASGRISSVITTPGTARYDVNFLNSAAANVIVFDGLAIVLEDGEAHTTVHWDLEIIMTCRAIGSTGNLFGQGTWKSTDVNNRFALGANPQGGITAMLPWNTAPAVGANFDTTLSQAVSLFFTQTVATGSMTLHQYSLIAPN
jgi:hypothetical protein